MRKQQLRARRGSIVGLMGLGTSGTGLQAAWTQRVEVIVQELFTESMPGPAPCEYAFCLAGSGARHEASPYSDLDCFILVADSGPDQVQYFVRTCEVMKEILGGVEGNSGLRFCNIMSPFGDPSNPRAPKLIRTPHDMADLVEWAPDRIEGHISGGLQEHRFSFGTEALYADFKTDLNTVVGKTCFRFSSRPVITRSKKMGLEVIKEVVNDPRYAPPSRTAETFHVKEQFYRPIQFIAKGLAWYYSVDAAGTTEQLAALVRDNHMSQTVANNFLAVLNVMAKYRFQLHLDREGEKDFIYTNQGARDLELQPLEAKGPGGRNAEEKERYNRLKSGTYLTPDQAKDLVDVISNLAFVMRLAREFVQQKEKTFGKRGNPFVTA